MPAFFWLPSLDGFVPFAAIGNADMTRRSGSRVLTEALCRAGVTTVWGYPGGAIMPLYDELLDSPIRHVLTRHEQGAIHAADGYARASGRLGVAIATSGPGATNLTTGICTAMMDSVPLLCLTGQVASPLIGTDGFQEADTYNICTPITKQNYLVRSVDDLPRVLVEAIYIAQTGRPGPVLVDIPKDVLLGHTNEPLPDRVNVPGYEPSPRLNPGSVRNAHALLRASRRPVCIVGGGCRLAEAVEEFREWCRRTQVPVASTLMGLGSAAPAYSGYLGMLGMHGLRRANRAVHEADLILGFGNRFDDRMTGATDRFAAQAKVVHIDIDAAELGKIIPVDVPIHADLKSALTAWNALLEQDPIQPASDWHTRVLSYGTGLVRRQSDEPGRVAPTEVLDELFDIVGSSAVVATDVGQNQMWAAQRCRADHPRKWITSGGAGTMGFGMPSAMGAQMARPDALVVAIVGDGGFQMTQAEMATIRRLNLPVKVLIMDNQFLGMVRQWQEMFFDRRYSSVDLSDNPDFAALARVYGFEAFTLSERKDIRGSLERWLSCQGPALLHAICQAEESVYPMVPAGASLAEMVEAPE